MSNIRNFSNILKTAIQTPFQNIFSTEKTRILFCLLKINVEKDGKAHFKIIIKYGEYSWEVIRSVIYVLKIQAEFRELCRSKGIVQIPWTGQSVEDIKFSLERINELANIVQFYKLYGFYGISEYSFKGDYIFENDFDVKMQGLEVDPGYCAFFTEKNKYDDLYVVVKKEYIIFIDDRKTQNIKFLLAFDNNIVMEYKQGLFFNKLTLTNLKQKITFKSVHKKSMSIFKDKLSLVLENSNHKNDNRFNSFSPLRSNTPMTYLIDGKKYFDELYKELKNAKNEIFIAGWWVYSETYLRRRVVNNKLDKKYRLDNVLKARAKAGVKIYILLYREFEMALPINSAYSMHKFIKLHPNVQVFRHPEFYSDGLIYWSHHEKTVIIDQKIGFVGGIDLCLGRYDNKEHLLFDVKPENEEKHFNKNREAKINEKREIFGNEDQNIWPGNDFSNPLKRDFMDIGKDKEALINRNTTPRMPWHDVHCKVRGLAAIDLGRHFIERWNRIKMNSASSRNNFLIPIEEEEADFTTEKFTGKTQILRSIGQWSNRYVTEQSIMLGYENLIKNAKKFIYIENQFFISKCVSTEEMPINTLGLTIVDRIKRAVEENEDFKIYIVIPLLPAFEADLESTSSNIQEIIRIQSEAIIKSRKSLFNALKEIGIDYSKYVLFLSLRNGNVTEGRITSEQIYVHSKIIIADGEKCIIGSANFNDRSMCGDRDSELAIYIEDDSGFTMKLLKNLLKEHLGIEDTSNRLLEYEYERELMNKFNTIFNKNEIINLEKTEIFDMIKNRAKINTKLFKQLFRVAPDNNIRSKKKLKNFIMIEGCAENMPLDQLVLIYNRVFGHFVIYPAYFLIDEKQQNSSILGNIIPKYIFY